RLTMALIHLSWQGLAVAALSMMVSRALQRSSASARYVVQVAALLLLALCLPATYLAVDVQLPVDNMAVQSSTAASMLADRDTTLDRQVSPLTQQRAAGDGMAAPDSTERTLENSAATGGTLARPVVQSAANESAPRVWLRRILKPAAPYATAVYLL